MVNGVQEKDLLTNIFRSFKFKRPFTNYKLQIGDYMRPDLISLRVYGVYDYWWVVLRCNPELEDVWNDFAMSPETIIVNASVFDKNLDPATAPTIEVSKAEYYFPKAKKAGEYIKVPNILDVQELFSKIKAK